MDFEKEDDNLDYGTYYSTDGDKWTDDTEVRGDLNRKKNIFFRALPESPKPPPDPVLDDDNDGFSDNYDKND